MKAIKIAVVVMSILLVVGFGVVIYTISTRVSDGTLTESTEKSSKDAVDTDIKVLGSSKPFDDALIALPFGCHLADAQMQPGKIMLRFDGAVERGCQKVELYSSENGERLGGWTLETTADHAEEPITE